MPLKTFFVSMLSILITKTSFGYDRYGFESGLKNYHLWSCEGPKKVSLRGPASVDVNLKKKRSTKAPMTNAFGKQYENYKKRKEINEKKKIFHFFRQEKAAGIDFDRDGKLDCKRTYYKNSKQIKKEVCDYNHDGVVDTLEKYSRNGLKVFDGSNNDSDPFFEIKETCKYTRKDKRHAKCLREVEYSGDNKYDHERSFFVANFGVVREKKKNKKKRKQKRSVASLYISWLEKQVYEEGPMKVSNEAMEKDGPISDNLLPVHEKMPEVWEKIDAGKYNGFREPYRVMKAKWNKPSTTRAEKFFMGINGWMPENDACLSEAPSYCKQANYSRMGLAKNQKTYEMCLLHSFHSCREEKTTEAALCFDCIGKKEGKLLKNTIDDMIMPLIGDWSEECGEKPNYPDVDWDEVSDEEFDDFSDKLDEEYDLVFDKWQQCREDARGEVPSEIAKDSPKDFFKSELFGFLVHENCLKEQNVDSPEELMKFYNQMIAQSFSCFKDGKNPQSWFQMRRLLRAFKPDLYSKFQSEAGLKVDGKTDSGGTPIPENWKPQRDKLCKYSNIDCKYTGPEYDGMKFVCDPGNYAEISSGGMRRTNLFVAKEDEGKKTKRIAFNPPLTTIGWEGDTKWGDLGGHIVGHAILGHTHGVPRQQSDGKWVCNWNAEIDYCEACNGDFEQVHGKGTEKENCESGCNSFPTSHLKPNGDFTDEYLEIQNFETFDSSGRRNGRNPSVADSLEGCEKNH